MPRAAAAYGYDEYGDPIVTATPVPDSQSGQAAAGHTCPFQLTTTRQLIPTPLTAGQPAQISKHRRQFLWM
ncbi:MAG: hypothetical protein ACLURP_12035 [Ruminococcus sp.]